MRSAHALLSISRQNKDIVGSDKVNYSRTQPSTCVVDEKSAESGKMFFLDADDHPDSHQNLIITFCPIYNVP